jgi:hypothetical protein
MEAVNLNQSVIARRLPTKQSGMVRMAGVLYATDGISFITIPDCHNFLSCLFFTGKKFRNDALGG